jgi:hypothetical protein
MRREGDRDERGKKARVPDCGRRAFRARHRSALCEAYRPPPCRRPRPVARRNAVETAFPDAGRSTWITMFRVGFCLAIRGLSTAIANRAGGE